MYIKDRKAVHWIKRVKENREYGEQFLRISTFSTQTSEYSKKMTIDRSSNRLVYINGVHFLTIFDSHSNLFEFYLPYQWYLTEHNYKVPGREHF